MLVDLILLPHTRKRHLERRHTSNDHHRDFRRRNVPWIHTALVQEVPVVDPDRVVRSHLQVLCLAKAVVVYPRVGHRTLQDLVDPVLTHPADQVVLDMAARADQATADPGRLRDLVEMVWRFQLLPIHTPGFFGIR